MSIFIRKVRFPTNTDIASCWNDKIPMARTKNEICLLYADDLVFQLRYKYKVNGKEDPKAQGEAEKCVQSYLDELQGWMNKWGLALAPKKCSQLTLSQARSNDQKETLKISL